MNENEYLHNTRDMINRVRTYAVSHVFLTKIYQSCISDEVIFGTVSIHPLYCILIHTFSTFVTMNTVQKPYTMALQTAQNSIKD